MNIKKLAVTLAALASVASANALTLNSITPAEFDPGNEVFAVRAKDFGNGESGGDIYLGNGDLGVGANRVETVHAWQETNLFSLTYNSLSGVVSVLVGGTLLEDTFEAGKLIEKFTLQIRDNDGTFDYGLANVAINGVTVVPGVLPIPDGTNYLEVGDLPAGSFSVTGSLVIEQGYSASNEHAKVELRAFAASSASVPDSGATAMLLGLGVLGLAAARKRFSK